MSDRKSYDRDDDSHVRSSRERRSSPNEDSGGSGSHRCKFLLIHRNDTDIFQLK